jgi:hypothetical protein
MNERIKELAEQAESSRLEYNSYTMMNNMVREFDKEKFAELIVKECIGVAVDNGCGDFVDIEHLLLKHFGVE